MRRRQPTWSNSGVDRQGKRGSPEIEFANRSTVVGLTTGESAKPDDRKNGHRVDERIVNPARPVVSDPVALHRGEHQ